MVSILQLSFPSNASLKCCISLKPNPPCFFDFVNFSQEIQHIFFLSGFESHQNRVRADWILLHRLAGSLKQLIEYVAITESTYLSIMSLPALERNREDHLIDLCLILSTIKAKISFFQRPKLSGKLRYLPFPPSFSIPSVRVTLSFISCGVLLEKVMDDLCRFIIWPYAVSYLLRISLSVSQQWGFVLLKNIVSSAKTRWFILGLPLAILIPGKLPLSCALLHRPERTSLHMMNIYGDRGSPWRIPRCGIT